MCIGFLDNAHTIFWPYHAYYNTNIKVTIMYTQSYYHSHVTPYLLFSLSTSRPFSATSESLGLKGIPRERFLFYMFLYIKIRRTLIVQWLNKIKHHLSSIGTLKQGYITSWPASRYVSFHYFHKDYFTCLKPVRRNFLCVVAYCFHVNFSFWVF